MFGRSGRWTLTVDGPSAVVDIGDGTSAVPLAALRDRHADRGTLWCAMTLRSAGATLVLDGISRWRLARLDRALGDVVAEADRLERLRDAYQRDGQVVAAWWASVLADAERESGRWLARDTIARWHSSRPAIPSDAFLAVCEEPRLAAFRDEQPGALREAVDAWSAVDLSAWGAARNQAFLARERIALREFFDTVEKSPLTEEQVEAVVTFDSRVRVIAAAGSGKTSTMIARAAYAIEKNIAAPGEILLLAFNKKAAEELAQRTSDRLGDRAMGVKASTFHAFGLTVIGQATGRKPRVSSALDSDDGVGRVAGIIAGLRATDPVFASAWGLLTCVFDRDLPDLEEPEAPEDWDRASGRSGFRTHNREVVKSSEERLICNWLFYNGVRYEYERDYELDTAGAEHGQYRPDFYYPEVGVYHEHWALGPDGRPPPHFAGYAEAMQWKRDLHAEAGTTLLETTSAGVRDGTAFEALAEQLKALGVTLTPDPDREVPAAQRVDDAAFVRLIRTFMKHAKSNRLTVDDLRARASASGRVPIRARLFLQVYERVIREWEQLLADAGEVDFEDMLGHAADLIEAGRYASPYRVVCVDEMQDSSADRARLIGALVAAPGRYLYAVGDNWQAINAFAGADLSVMTEFEEWFGPGPTVRLTRTFRSPQSLCDIAGAFVTRNPTQLSKRVRSSQRDTPPTVTAVTVSSPTAYAAAASTWLTDLDTTITEPASVYILGRYQRTHDRIASVLHAGWRNLTVTYSTVHAAKGKEADYVIVPDLRAGAFPSVVADDPLLALAKPHADTYPHAEERRLFYVALTRARRAVLLLTTSPRESPFIVELVKDGDVTLTTSDGEPAEVVICPRCMVNRMVRRRGSYGAFYGCTGFPACRGTRRI
jgi:DNA helicase-4